MAFLSRINTDGSEGEFWEISDKPLVVGRGDRVDAFIDDDSLSRSHFLVVQEHDGFFLIDLDSRNGTWVNGQPVSAHKLTAPEMIVAGQSLFCFALTPVVQARSILALLPEHAASAHLTSSRAQ